MKGAKQMTKKAFLAKFSVLITLNRRIIRTEHEITKMALVLSIEVISIVLSIFRKEN